MISKQSLDKPGAIQARLRHLRGRKAALDDLIRCLENYSVYQLPKLPRPPAKLRAGSPPGKLA